MPLVPPCPPGDVFGRYLDDRLSGSDAPELEAHISTCKVCEDRLKTALKSDPLLRLARVGRGSAWTVPAAVRNRLLGLCPATPDTNGTVAQDTTPPVPRAKTPPEVAGLLQPPQAPDELGRLGGYRVLRVLGKGGMGVVCLGVDEKLNRKVAIKVISPALAADPRAAAMFHREAQALAATSHDHVVTVFQVGQDGDTLFLVMEFLEGETVAEWMIKTPHRPLGEVLRVAREAAEGLACAHSKGVIHRDFKPANLWRTADHGRIKLIDFGLARQPDNEPLTEPGRAMGTAGYMAPEQARGGTVDARADLFSLGVVLYELCSGASPFARPNYYEALVALAEHVPEPLDRPHPWLPAELVTLVTQLLAKDPANRVQTAAAVVERLQRIEEYTRAEATAGFVGQEELQREIRPTTVPLGMVAEVGRTPAFSRAAVPRRRRAWAALAAALLVLTGLGYELSGGGQPQKEDPDVKADERKSVELNSAGEKPNKEPVPVIVGGRTPPPPPSGQPLSPFAWTKQPAVYSKDWTWTLESIHARKKFDEPIYQPSGNLVAVASEDGTVRLYDAKTGKFQKALVYPTDGCTTTWSPDGRYLVISENRQPTTSLWDVEKGVVVREFAGFLHTPRVSPDGKWLAGINYLQTTVIINDLTKNGKPVELALANTQADSIAWHPKSTHLMVGYLDGQVRIWDVAKPKEPTREFDTGMKSLKCVAWPTEDVQAFGSTDSYMIRYRGKRGPRLGGGAHAYRIDSAPDGKTLVVSTTLGLDFVDATKADNPSKRIEAGNFATWSTDGKELMVTTNDGVKFIDITGKVLRTIPQFDPDLVYNPQRGYFIPPAKGENPFVFVVQFKHGQKTYTPEEFEKLTDGKWKNNPDSLK